jgi:hypothetical protein
MVTVTIDKRKLEQAIKRNPLAVRNGALIFMRDSINSYWRGINNTPKWRVGNTGGGVPVADKRGGNLRKSHKKEIAPFLSRIWVDEGKASYAKYVHGGTYKMTARPWLKWTQEAMSRNVNQYMQKFLKDIVINLSK